MKARHVLAAGSAALHAVALSAAAPVTLTVDPATPIDALVDGRPVRLLPMANGGRVVLNPDAAARLGIRAGMFGARGRIGPILVPGKTAVVDVTIAGSRNSQRILWFERAIAPGQDGAVGPANIPAETVIFRLRAPSAGERRFTLPLNADGDFGRLETPLAVGGETVRVSWDLTRRLSLATAATGADLARALGGRFEGAGWQEPIRMGVSRPARRLVLGSPLMLGPLRIGMVATRVKDFGDASAIRDAEFDPDADGGEIVVTGKSSKVKAEHSLQIGLDDMTGCSSIAFDKAARRIVLMCRPG